MKVMVWAAVFPEATEQRCWNHRLLNILDKLPHTRQAGARSLLATIPYAEIEGRIRRCGCAPCANKVAPATFSAHSYAVAVPKSRPRQ